MTGEISLSLIGCPFVQVTGYKGSNETKERPCQIAMERRALHLATAEQLRRVGTSDTIGVADPALTALDGTRLVKKRRELE